MFHVIRTIFICLLIATTGYVLTQYLASKRLQTAERRLIPMPEKQANGGASNNMPPMQPVQQPVMPTGEGPLFTVDV